MTLVFENCRVPEENLLGEKHEAFTRMVRGVRENEDALGMATFVGLLGWELELASAYLKRRDRELSEEPSEEQLLLLADFASTVEAARTIACKTAWLFDEGMKATAEYGLCHAQFQKLGDSAAETLGKLFPSEEDLTASGLDRPMRDMGIVRIGRNVARARRLKLARDIVDGNASA